MLSSFKTLVTTGTEVLGLVFKMGKFSLEVTTLLVLNGFWALKYQYFVQPYHIELKISLEILKNLINHLIPVMSIFKHNSNIYRSDVTLMRVNILQSIEIVNQATHCIDRFNYQELP